MQIRYGKKMKYKGINRSGIICVSLTIFLNIIGLGYGSWLNDIKVENIINTGNINVVFNSYEVIEISDSNIPAEQKKPELNMIQDQKTLNINITDAYPGYSAYIKYSVINQGSVPVICEIKSIADELMEGLVEYNVQEPLGVLNAFGNIEDIKEGTISFTLKDIKENEKYNISFELIFKQYNAFE